jgi:hypothetical protein
MEDVVSGTEFIDERQVPLIKGILVETPDKGFVFFGGHEMFSFLSLASFLG